MRSLSRIDEIIDRLNRGEISLSYAAQEFWAIVSEIPRRTPEIFERIPPETSYKLIRAGLLSADPDMFRLCEGNLWLREKVGNVIRLLPKDELEEISRAILNSNLERSSIASRVFYRLKKLRST
ncbi:MAG: hypothetical protein DRO05_03085 [Thermoproteota archaeon]|mgnify:CR=1 FL=1|nr:MAG: hypothetical protein DRO05_03085 [Candidatus Korarchaeota archaeon]